MTEQETTTSGTPSDKISERELKILQQIRDNWLDASQLVKYHKKDLDGYKIELYEKYNININDYYIDGETGAIKKRRVRKE